jgi:hypothetical protein
MSEPTAMLRGDLRALDRNGALTAVLGDPRNHTEGALLVLLARLLGDEEAATLIVMVRRGGQREYVERSQRRPREPRRTEARGDLAVATPSARHQYVLPAR